MKTLKKLLLGVTALLTAFGFVACGGDVTDSSSENGFVENSSIADSSVEDTLWKEYEIITIAEALEICATANEPTTERYYIRGIIQELNVSYGEMTIKDETGEFMCMAHIARTGL